MPDHGVSCAACHFYMVGDDKGGVCRRYPPQVMIVPGKLVGQFGPANLFPAVNKDAWCGEYASARGVEALMADSMPIGEAVGEA